ncbi:YdcF family protein [Patescibacteria group bacterium]
MKETGVLILGYNSEEKNWEYTVWGVPPDKPGRLPKALAVIIEEDADIAVISGGTEKFEAQRMKERLYKGLKQLREFTVFPAFQRFSKEEIQDKLDKILNLEETAKNTAENMVKTGAIFNEAGVGKVIIVTSPDHISRALRDAIKFWGKDYPELARNVYGTPSVTLYSNRGTPEDKEIAKIENVVIVEPPAMKKLNLRRILDVLGNPEALFEIDAVLKKHGK